MTGAPDARDWIVAAMTQVAQARDELTELDAAAGDGDLGVTVASGAREVAAAVRALPDDAPPYEYWRAAGAAFARGNPSSYAALIGSGLLAAARRTGDATACTRTTLLAALDAAFDVIAERGRSEVGQRTVLDALDPAREALRDIADHADDAPGVAAVADAIAVAAGKGADATASMAPQKGRALWVGDRARGTRDAGAVALQRLLESFASTAPGRADATLDTMTGGTASPVAPEDWAADRSNDDDADATT